MDKVICCICGTPYPQNAEECPVCGYVQPAQEAHNEFYEAHNYTYVKGGRFSKKNVKKRNSARQSSMTTDGALKKKMNIGSIVLITVLLVAILAAASYIILRYFLPNDFLYEGFENLHIPGTEQKYDEYMADDTEPALPQTSESLEEAEPKLNCTAVSIDTEYVEFDTAGSTIKLNITLEPVNTSDVPNFSSSNDMVATVNSEGLITAVGEGSAIITVSCGSEAAECLVACAFATEPETIELTLNRKSITLETEGQSWMLYNGEIDPDKIEWVSDDVTVAVIKSGKVTAVGEGSTSIHATYGEQTVSCEVQCEFDSEESTEAGEISEATGDGKTYSLYNPYGYAEDVSINPGEKFTLYLIDSSYNKVEATWTVSDTNVCTFDDNTVTGVTTGYTTITAKYAGKEYVCQVRVR